MKTWSTAVIATVILCSAACCTVAGDIKVATVDIGAVLRSHPKTEINTAILQKQVDEFEAENRGMLEKRKAMLEELESMHGDAQNKALSESAREKKLGLARDKYGEVKGFEKEIRENAQLRRQQVADQKERMRNVILTEVGGIIEAYAKDQKIDLVLDAGALSVSGIQMIVYQDDALDITEAVAKKLAGKKKAEE